MAGLNGYPGFIQDFPQGHTKKFTIRITENDEPVPIDGSKFYLAFTTRPGLENTPFYTQLIDPPTDPAGGSTVGVIADSDTLSFPVGTVYYSVRFINADGEAYVIDMGKIKVHKAISGVVA